MKLGGFVEAALVWTILGYGQLAAQNRIARIVSYDAAGHILHRSSGFFLNKKHLMTNRNLLVDASRAQVILDDGSVYAIEGVLADDPTRDLISVSVKVPQDRVRELTFRPDLPHPGEQVFIVGASLNGNETTSGTIVSIRPPGSFGAILQIRANVAAGFRGAPVLDSAGNLVGIATAKVLPESQTVLAVATAGMRELLVPRRGLKLNKWVRAVSASKSVVDVKVKGGNDTDEFLTGLNYMWLDDFASALPHFERTIRITPIDPGLWFLIGDCLLNLGRDKEAAEAYLKTIRLVKVPIAELYFSLGIAYDRQQRYDQSVEAYKQSIRINSRSSKAHFGLGVAYLRIGDRPSAIAQYELLRTLRDPLASSLLSLIQR